jgi:hypothetical protein
MNAMAIQTQLPEIVPKVRATHARQHGNDDDDDNDARETRRRLSGNHRCTWHTRACDWCVFARVSGDRMEKGRRRKGACPSATLLLERKVSPCMALAYAPTHVNDTRTRTHIQEDIRSRGHRNVCHRTGTRQYHPHTH